MEHKYKKLAQSLRRRIEDGTFPPAGRLPSETELADRFVCSRQTVRQAVALLEAEGYVHRQRGSGTFIKERPAAQVRGKTIGVISTYVDDYIFSSIIRGIETVLSAHGCSMQLAFTRNREELEAKALRSMLAKGVDGMIVEPTKSGFIDLNRGLYLQFREKNIPVVFFNAYYPSLPDFPHVAMDDREAGRLVTDYLLRRGHRRIAGIFQADDLQGQLRYAGYAGALAQYGLHLEPGQLLWFTTQDIPLLPDEMLERVAQTVAGCTGLVCYNDQIAYMLCQALIRRGVRIPEELSVVSVDNSDLASACDPPLTTASHPKDLLGVAAAEQVLRMLEDPALAMGKEFMPELVVRGSAADCHLEKAT